MIVPYGFEEKQKRASRQTPAKMKNYLFKSCKYSYIFLYLNKF